MIDGIDGSGKSTALEAWKAYFTSQGNAIFDLKKYWIEKKIYPELTEIKSYDFIFSCEPTRVGIGQIIREELINKDKNYPAQAIAEAYSLDRLVLYHKIIIPILKDGKCIIQDRGLSTTLAYQTVQSTRLDFNTLANLPGNKLALDWRPDHLVLVDAEPQKAAERLVKRADKQDLAIFEQLETLQKNAAQFRNVEYQKIFLSRGTKIETLNGNEEIDIMKAKAVDLIKKILNN
jgi:thymidylate kinase